MIDVEDIPQMDTPGAYRRRIVLQAEGPRVFAALEDDFHHLYVSIVHDGSRVTQALGKTLRIPRSTCPGSIERLQAVVGLPLAEGARGLDPRQQCTHLFDMARLAMSHGLRAARGGSVRRRYDITVPDAVNKLSRPELRRDGELLLQWEWRGRAIAGPAPFACPDLFGKVDWKHLDPETLEAAMALRRAIWISHGRAAETDLKREEAGGQGVDGRGMPTLLKGACYSFQPEIHARGHRYEDNTLDFTHRPDALLAELAGMQSAPTW